MGKDNNSNSNSEDKGLFSSLMGYGGGHYYPSGAYPPYSGCPSHYCPPAGYPPPGGYPPVAYPPPGGYPPAAYPYPSASYHSGYGPNMGTTLAGGATAAAALYGAHHLSHGYGYGHGHGHGHFGHGYHGKFGKRWKHHGFFGRHKFKLWK